MYKVFIYDKPIIFSENVNNILPENYDQVIEYTDIINFQEIIDSFHLNQKVSRLIFYHPDIHLLVKAFFASSKLIEAAGGVAINEKKEMLFIFRHKRWDLPKGKIEQSEDKSHAAIREVKEETGVNTKKVLGELPGTYHMYKIDKRWVIKRTYWFELLADIESVITPQTEEGITRAKWVQKNEMNEMLASTYASLREMLEQHQRY